MEVRPFRGWRFAAEAVGDPGLAISPPYDVIDDGQDQWWGPTVPFEGFDEERWIQAYEFKPSWPLGLRVVHHGHAPQTAEHVAADRIGDVFGQVEIATLVDVMHRHTTSDQQLTVRGLLERQRLVFVLIVYLTHDFLDEILQRDQPRGSAEFIEHDDHLDALTPHLGQEILYDLAAWHESR